MIGPCAALAISQHIKARITVQTSCPLNCITQAWPDRSRTCQVRRRVLWWELWYLHRHFVIEKGRCHVSSSTKKELSMLFLPRGQGRTFVNLLIFCAAGHNQSVRPA